MFLAGIKKADKSRPRTIRIPRYAKKFDPTNRFQRNMMLVPHLHQFSGKKSFINSNLTPEFNTSHLLPAPLTGLNKALSNYKLLLISLH